MLSDTAKKACLLRRAADGLFVHLTDRTEGELALEDGPADEGRAALWHGILETWGRKTDLYPKAVRIGSDVFSLGTNYDEACGGQGVASLYGLPPSDRPEDVVRDKVALLVDCPDSLIRQVFMMGSYSALVGEGADDRASALNWEACISLSGAYRRGSYLEDLARDTGGPDYIVRYFPSGSERRLSPEEEELARWARSRVFLVCDEGDVTPLNAMRTICRSFRV